MFVVGIENDFEGGDIKDHDALNSAAVSLPWCMTGRARAGIATMDSRLLFFGTAGLATGELKDGPINKMKMGWTAGGGVEMAVPAEMVGQGRISLHRVQARRSAGLERREIPHLPRRRELSFRSAPLRRIDEEPDFRDPALHPFGLEPRPPPERAHRHARSHRAARPHRRPASRPARQDGGGSARAGHGVERPDEMARDRMQPRAPRKLLLDIGHHRFEHVLHRRMRRRFAEHVLNPPRAAATAPDRPRARASRRRRAPDAAFASAIPGMPPLMMMGTSGIARLRR